MIVDRLQHPLTRSEQPQNVPISGESVDGSDDSRTPWQPAGLRLPRVGDRVVVRLGGECRVVAPEGSYDAEIGTVGHDAWENGLTGVVEVLDDEPLMVAQGHRYTVGWDAWQRGARGRLLSGSAYAAIELEILADDDGG